MIGYLDPARIRKILVISLTNLGDIILTTPVLSHLRCVFPSSHLSVVIGPKGKDLLTNSSTVDDVIVYDKKQMSAFQKISWVMNLRQSRYDLVIDLRNTVIPYLIGAKYRTKMWHRAEPLKMRDKHLFRLEKIGIPVSGQAAFNFFSDRDTQSVLNKVNALGVKVNRPVVAVAPGAGSYLKRWDVNKFAQVASHFSGQGYSVVIVGSESEKGLGETILKSAQAINGCGLFTLRELAAFLAGVRLLVSCDSAIMHLGNELNIPVISIFGPTDFKKYAKVSTINRVVRKELLCAPCEKAHCRFERQVCMDDVMPDEVTQASRELLK